MTMMFIASPATMVLGAEPPPDYDNFKIVGPTMWAVGIVNCNGLSATLRVKKIDDCIVDTDPQTADLTVCPEQPSDILYYKLPQGSVFNKCNSPNHQPIITKVKNFKIDNNLVSFDAQINFVVPIGAADSVCD